MKASDAKSQAQEAGMKSVRIEMYFEAPPEKVWRAWTDPAWLSRWVGSDPQGKVLNVNLDVRAGGRYEITFADSDGTEHTTRGLYTSVEPHRFLAFGWGWKSEPGIETAVMVSLTPHESGTLMRFEHSGLGYVSSHNYESGWRSTFMKLEKMLEDGR